MDKIVSLTKQLVEKGIRMNISELKRKIKEDYGSNPLEKCDKDEAKNMLRLVKIYHDLKEEKDARVIDDITWEDIEMDEVFFRVNHTRSYAGEQILYHMLHMIKNDKPGVDEEADFFDRDEKTRVETEMKLRSLGKRYMKYYLPETIFNLDGLVMGGTFMYPILLLLLIGSFVISAFKPGFLAVTVAIAVVNLMVYMVVKMKYDSTLISLCSVREIVDFGDYVMKSDKLWEVYKNKEIEESMSALQKATKFLIYYKYTKNMIQSGDFVAIILEYIFGMTMIDAICCASAIKRLRSHKDEIIRLYEMIGNIDAAISVASFRRSLDSCKPELTSDGKISADGLYHPLLDNPVKNDFHMKRNSFFTGANATGKSTFMKAIAINVILGETIYTCTADKMCFPNMYVMTSMALRDDVLNGESYYVREIRYLKRMLEQVESGVKTLIVIDEILKGTNTKERVAASRAVLEYLADTSAVVITATHDIELVEQMDELYDAFYFECIVNDGEVKFTYEIREGVNKITNAIELMKVMGFPQQIIENAEKRR